MFGRLLCRLGWHRYGYWGYDYRCIRCGQKP
jgi:hypothetical protein